VVKDAKQPHVDPERAHWGRIGALASWKQTADPTGRTAPARRAFDDRFDREVDPEGVLDPTERARRAGYAKREYYARLAYKRWRNTRDRTAGARPSAARPPDHEVVNEADP
jgi:hypothetical protein